MGGQRILAMKMSADITRKDFIKDGKNMVNCEFPDGERYVGEVEDDKWPVTINTYN